MPRARRNTPRPRSGQPTTTYGTDDDAQRVKLSLVLTAILVHSQDEKPGDYKTPGAEKYPPLKIIATP